MLSLRCRYLRASNEGTPSIVGLESAGPADVPLIEPKTWAQFANLGTLLAGVAIIFAVGIASVNWKHAGKEMIHYTDGFHAPQGAGDAYYIRQDKKFHYLDVPSEDMTVQVPNYYYEWANCHSGGYECVRAAAAVPPVRTGAASPLLLTKHQSSLL